MDTLKPRSGVPNEFLAQMSYESSAKIAIERCRKLATFSEDAGGTRRTFLSSPMRDCHREIAAWLAPLGVEVKIDSAGNFRAPYAGADRDAPRLLIGSHLDTVPNAGAFDGILGVVLGVALLESLAGKRLPFTIELLGFSEEEGVRFGAPFIGSRALVGRLDTELLSRKDAKGASVRQAIHTDIDNHCASPHHRRDDQTGSARSNKSRSCSPTGTSRVHASATASPATTRPSKKSNLRKKSKPAPCTA